VGETSRRPSRRRRLLLRAAVAARISLVLTAICSTPAARILSTRRETNSDTPNEGLRDVTTFAMTRLPLKQKCATQLQRSRWNFCGSHARRVCVVLQQCVMIERLAKRGQRKQLLE
jgi:hypothetical protein